MIRDYPDLLIELDESSQKLLITQQTARKSFDEASRSIKGLLDIARSVFDAAIESSWKQDSAVYTHIREVAAERDKAKESA